MLCCANRLGHGRCSGFPPFCSTAEVGSSVSLLGSQCSHGDTETSKGPSRPWVPGKHDLCFDAWHSPSEQQVIGFPVEPSARPQPSVLRVSRTPDPHCSYCSLAPLFTMKHCAPGAGPPHSRVSWELVTQRPGPGVSTQTSRGQLFSIKRSTALGEVRRLLNHPSRLSDPPTLFTKGFVHLAAKIMISVPVPVTRTSAPGWACSANS